MQHETDTDVLVIGLESSGTRWVEDILRLTIGRGKVHHFSLPRFSQKDGIRYVHSVHHFAPHQHTSVVLVVRDLTIAKLSSEKHFDQGEDREKTIADAIFQMRAYLGDARFNTHVWSYETSMLLQDAYVHPLVAEITGVVFPSWLYDIQYSDGNPKYFGVDNNNTETTTT